MRGRKTKAQKEEEEAESLLAGLVLLGWLLDTFKSKEKTEALCRDLQNSGEYMKQIMLIMQGKEGA